MESVGYETMAWCLHLNPRQPSLTHFSDAFSIMLKYEAFALELSM